MDNNDAISLALAAHPRPWHSNGFAVYDAEGMLVNAWNWQEFITTIANAFDPQREQQITALVEAALILVGVLEDNNYTAPGLTRLNAALAPFTPQGPA